VASSLWWVVGSVHAREAHVNLLPEGSFVFHEVGQEGGKGTLAHTCPLAVGLWDDKPCSSSQKALSFFMRSVRREGREF